MKTPEEMAEEYANDWHKDCDYSPEILRHTLKATKTVFLAGYKTAKAVVEAELKLVQARREETPGLGAVCYALNNILEKMG